MATTILALILFGIFTVLSAFHFYWLFGGEWGLASAIPSKGKEAATLGIPKVATLIVALGLLAFGLLYLIKSGLITYEVPRWIVDYGYWFIPGIFLMRAIGDFNYVGMFKKVKNSVFAKADSKVFVPLCLTIGTVGILIQILAY